MLLQAVRHAVPASLSNDSTITSGYQKYEARLLSKINGTKPRRRWAPSKKRKP